MRRDVRNAIHNPSHAKQAYTCTTSIYMHAHTDTCTCRVRVHEHEHVHAHVGAHTHAHNHGKKKHACTSECLAHQFPCSLVFATRYWDGKVPIPTYAHGACDLVLTDAIVGLVPCWLLARGGKRRRDDARRHAICRARRPDLDVINQNDPGRACQLQAEFKTVANARRRELVRDLDTLPTRGQLEIVRRAQPLPVFGDIEDVHREPWSRVLLGGACPKHDLDDSWQRCGEVAQHQPSGCGGRQGREHLRAGDGTRSEEGAWRYGHD